jgi:GT2 family glycosyltransferase
MDKFLVIVPTYGAFDYAHAAVHSLLANSPPPVHCLLVDDASPGWAAAEPEHLAPLAAEFGNRYHQLRFDAWGGLTRSWNAGLEAAARQGYVYACAANSDLLFPAGWVAGLVEALEAGWDLVGPLSNAPGESPLQFVGRYHGNYRLTDDLGYLNALQRDLLRAHRGEAFSAKLNGFCLVAKTATWQAGAYAPGQAFRPANLVNSKGQDNPTPLMTLNEDELQGRWRAAGRKIGVVPASFVFHYRSVSRGDRHRKGRWYRRGQRDRHSDAL